MRRLIEACKGSLVRLLAATATVYTIAATALPTSSLILVLNGIALSVAAGVCIAYMPVFVGAMPARRPTRGELLGAGIFFLSASVIGMRALSIVARDLGWPNVYNTGWMTAIVTLGIIGGFLHLWAPNAVDGRLPRERWASTGIVVAAGVFIVFCLWGRHAAAIHPPVELR